MKNQNFSKSPKFFAFYLESSKNVLPLRNPLGSARPTQHRPQTRFRASVPKLYFFLKKSVRGCIRASDPIPHIVRCHHNPTCNSKFESFDIIITRKSTPKTRTDDARSPITRYRYLSAFSWKI